MIAKPAKTFPTLQHELRLAQVHGGAARLEKGEGGLAIGIAFHGEEEHAFHEASTIAPTRAGRLTTAKHLC